MFYLYPDNDKFSWEGKIRKSSLCKHAASSILFLPMMVAISIKASTSSLDWNNGNFLVRKKRRIIPADQTSTAERETVNIGFH